jgi:hypothetical protein
VSAPVVRRIDGLFSGTLSVAGDTIVLPAVRARARRRVMRWLTRRPNASTSPRALLAVAAVKIGVHAVITVTAFYIWLLAGVVSYS